jgi:hypothetical protein
MSLHLLHSMKIDGYIKFETRMMIGTIIFLIFCEALSLEPVGEIGLRIDV